MFSDKPPEKVSTHIPYRDSKLTHILKDSLGSNTFTHLIITLSPSYLCLGETISTLLFTKNAKAVRQNIVENTAFKNEIQHRVNLKAAMENQNRGQRSLSMGAGGSNSLLNQMAGSAVNNDEDDPTADDIDVNNNSPVSLSCSADLSDCGPACLYSCRQRVNSCSSEPTQTQMEWPSSTSSLTYRRTSASPSTNTASTATNADSKTAKVAL